MSVLKHLFRFRIGFNGLSINKSSQFCLRNDYRRHQFQIQCLVNIHSTPWVLHIMEFFDDKENWDKKIVNVGRAWKLDELRIKSNSDLHKLWYVLLKERNMLLTMEHEYMEKYEPMPNPERIHKVRESMRNLETVVKERNRAYYKLETGETGEQDTVDDYNCFGLPYKRKLREYYVERQFNNDFKKFEKRRHNIVVDHDVVSFLKRYNEKQNNMRLAKKTLMYKHVCGLFRRFADIDEEALRAEFPDVDIEKAKRDRMSRGPRVNMY